MYEAIQLHVEGLIEDKQPVPGSIVVSATDPSAGVLVAVQDSGPGLPAERRDLFDAFYTTKPEGLGMGLAICRTIIESYGGRIWATPNTPQGAVFQFVLAGVGGESMP